MARISVETAKSVLNTLMSEQERDREHLQRMMSHSEKLSDHLTKLRDEELFRIDEDTAERKENVRRLFNQLLTVEEERRQRLQSHILDIEGGPGSALPAAELVIPQTGPAPKPRISAVLSGQR
jgi:hypothetical protein